ncbi:MAG: RNA polymerase sigma factor [Bacteroidales bacterium]|nr:RNA polymerase sigma factor [Bacteroidales bacterium]
MKEKATGYSDKELLDIFRSEGRRDYAFNLIVRKYQERLYWHLRRILIDHHDTDDTLQNTFLKVWQNLENFREASSLFTWLYRIATNEALMLLKQRRRKFFVPITDVEKQLGNSIDNGEYFDGDALQLKLQKALLTLPEKQRIVFNMKYFDEMKYEEMAEILGTSVGALKASYHHAVAKIEKYLENH